MPNTSVAAAWQEEQHAPGDQQLIDRLGAEHRPDHELVQDDAQQLRRSRPPPPSRRSAPVVLHVQVIHRVHAAHDQLGIADPHHVDDAKMRLRPSESSASSPPSSRPFRIASMRKMSKTSIQRPRRFADLFRIEEFFRISRQPNAARLQQIRAADHLQHQAIFDLVRRICAQGTRC